MTPPIRKLLLAILVLVVGAAYLPLALVNPVIASALAIGYIAVVVTAAVVARVL